MSKADKVFMEFNCKNGVYSVDGTTVKPLGYMSAVNLDASITTDNKYGDGKVIMAMTTDSGYSGSLEMTARDTEFEIDLGFVEELAQGMGVVEVTDNKTIDIGLECQYVKADGVTKTKRMWLLGVNVAPASVSLNQNTDSTNENAASYGLTIKGRNKKTADGTEDAVDANGNTKAVRILSAIPTDASFDTFFDSVPVPSEKPTTEPDDNNE